MEALVTKLHEKIAVAKAHPLQTTQLVVQNRGMQHWLNMQLASSSSGGVCMNMKYSLVASYLWQVIRTCVPDAPRINPFNRELLVWKIYQALGNESIRQHPIMQQPTEYWFNPTDSSAQQSLKRFQLSLAQADLFEQYWMYRPDWTQQWETEQPPHWQAFLWQSLSEGAEFHPVKIIRQAQVSLRSVKSTLAPDVYIFGINSMPPLYIEFLFELSRHQNIFLFLLNPSEEYWFDLMSEKAVSRKKGKLVRDKKIQAPLTPASPNPTSADIGDSLFSSLPFETGNPVLSALGRQSQEFFEILYNNQELIDDHVYLRPNRKTVLHCLQNDFFHLTDNRTTPEPIMDNSVTVIAAHSHLREVQALHDWLLARLDEDTDLKPKEIIIMCPQIETYAPYIQAVFNSVYLPFDQKAPRIPCSIADRKESDSSPLIQAFINLLHLPDSRFQVSEILGYLRLPPMQRKFDITSEDIALYEVWLKDAAIHWGLDAKHKSAFLVDDGCFIEGKSDESDGPTLRNSSRFTWREGLGRLLKGFAYADHKEVVNDSVYLPWVEGDNAIKLGKLMHIIDQLAGSVKAYKKNRNAVDWQLWLTDLFHHYFLPEKEELLASETILDAIRSLSENTQTAGFNDLIPLEIVTYFLEHQFSQPEQGRQFMTGQVTFCSMLPMRSIPFKIIGLLGMNDGEFPRQRPPLGFDLLSESPRRKGDRSRRDEDRCLFLEALVSARQALYLSYQGNDAKTNSARQPSLVLDELIHYLDTSYWKPSLQSLDSTAGSLKENSLQAIRRIPLQPFSQSNYRPPHHSYDPKWLNLASAQVKAAPTAAVFDKPIDYSQPVDISELVNFFSHPPKAFARQRLGLFLESDTNTAVNDTEPFKHNHLDRYQAQASYIGTQLKRMKIAGNAAQSLDVAKQTAAEAESISHLTALISLGGHLPDTPVTDLTLMDWRDQALEFAEHVVQTGGHEITQVRIAVDIDRFKVTARLPLLSISATQQQTKAAEAQVLLFWRLADAKGKDIVNLWLHHLIAHLKKPLRVSGGASEDDDDDDDPQRNGAIHTIGIFRSKKGEPNYIGFSPVTDAAKELRLWLSHWQDGLAQPNFINANLALEMASDADFSAASFIAFWRNDFQQTGLAYDPYYAHFWKQPPDWNDDMYAEVMALYGRASENLQQLSSDAVLAIIKSGSIRSVATDE